jgi:SAM-dependent methyltransferase
MDEQHIKAEVQQRYAAIARGTGCCGDDCCGDTGSTGSPLVDYSGLAAEVVEEANLGLGCGTPTRYAGLRPGDTVLDLGSGAGMDVFIAARAVGPQGRVIGVDMTPEMIARAWNNTVKVGYRNVEFRLGDIENLPVGDGTVDIAISNCVINLVPDKRRAFAEIYRVLKPGGRFSISDIVTQGSVPETMRQDMELWAGCLAGAMEQEDYLQVIREAGFQDVHINQSQVYDSPGDKDYRFSSITVEGHKL